jgi:hypothetical protein
LIFFHVFFRRACFVKIIDNLCKSDKRQTLFLSNILIFNKPNL